MMKSILYHLRKTPQKKFFLSSNARTFVTSTTCTSTCTSSIPATAEPSRNFKLEQIYTGCLSEFAYYIESNGEAIIIDPLRDINPYIELAKVNNAKIKYILETHFHADFVSGHVELAKKTGAQIVFGPSAVTKYESYVAKDGEEFKVGNIKIKILHTPGHTLESTSFLLYDENNKPYGVFTGDTIFLGEVGRPDLAVKKDTMTKEDLAGMLYDSINEKILPLPADILIYPGHGAGSACGKSIQSGKFDTLANQKLSNYALKPMKREEFIKVVSSDLPTPPKYFFEDVAINKEGGKSIEYLLANYKPLNVTEFEMNVKEGAVILDCREPEEYKEGGIIQSINVGLTQPFAIWAANLIDLHSNIVIIADPGKEQEVIIRLARVGFDNIVGYLKEGIEAWIDAGKPLEEMNIIRPSEFKAKLAEKINVLDVRNPNEWELGYVKGSKLISLNGIRDRVNELDKNQTYYIYCKAGGRSHVAYTLLRKLGFNNIYSVQGGFDRITSEDVEIVHP